MARMIELFFNLLGFGCLMLLTASSTPLEVNYSNFAQTPEISKQSLQHFLLSRVRNRNRLASSTLSKPVSVDRSSIEQLLEVRCLPRQMTVLLHYKSRPKPEVEEITRYGHLYTKAATVAACPPVEGHVLQGEALSLTVGYDDCNVRRTESSNSVTHKMTIFVQANAKASDDDDDRSHVNINQTYEVQCVHPLSQAAEEKPAFSLLLANSKYARSYWANPYVLDANSYVYLTIHTNSSISWYENQEIFGYPVDCWVSLSRFSDGFEEENEPKMKQFVKKGCPNNNTCTSCTFHHFTNKATKVGLQLSNLLTISDKSSKVDNISLTCSVVPCIQSFTVGLFNIPKCPASYTCSGSANVVLPAQLRGIRRIEVSAGPILVRAAENEQKQARAAVDCALKCRRTMTSPAPSIDENVTLRITILVAFASFAFGVFVVGALWWMHVQTDPKKLATGQGPFKYACHKPNKNRGPPVKTAASSQNQKNRFCDADRHSVFSSNSDATAVSFFGQSAGKIDSRSGDAKTDATTARLLLNTLQ